MQQEMPSAEHFKLAVLRWKTQAPDLKSRSTLDG
jgi:hypothetical protein